MTHSITLTLPDDLFASLQRIAQGAQQTVEEVVLCALATRLPIGDGLPPDIAENLVELELLDEATLRQVMFTNVPEPEAIAIHELLFAQQCAPLDESAQAELNRLMRKADLVMLRKARAALLLRLRGKPVPTLKELRDQSPVF